MREHNVSALAFFRPHGPPAHRASFFQQPHPLKGLGPIQILDRSQLRFEPQFFIEHSRAFPNHESLHLYMHILCFESKHWQPELAMELLRCGASPSIGIAFNTSMSDERAVVGFPNLVALKSAHPEKTLRILSSIRDSGYRLREFDGLLRHARLAEVVDYKTLDFLVLECCKS